jgi:Zn-dependent protease
MTDTASCPSCAADLPASALSCPQCRRLTHADDLESLTKRAKEAWRQGQFAQERLLWAESLPLLPEDTVQHRTVAGRIAEIDRMIPGAAAQQQPKTGAEWKKTAMGAGPALLLLLSKGKFLLLGLTKVGTLLTMLASLGVYWALYGWALALGVVVSIYIHEMGHVAKIRQYGFPASPPMFIPGLGAIIWLRGMNLPPIPDSRIGLAGPIYGLGASAAALAVYYLTRVPIWGVIAHFSAWVNLFNLIPVWQLDGARGMRSFTRSQRGLVLITAVALWLVSSNPMLLLIGLGCGYRLFTRDQQAEPDNQGLMQFLGLLVALTVVVMLSAGSAAVGAAH